MATAKKATVKHAVVKPAAKKAPAAQPAKPMFTRKTMALYERACKSRGLKPELPKITLPGLAENHKRSIIAYAMLCVIIEWVNAGEKKVTTTSDIWVPDFLNCPDKYYTWHRVKADEKRPSGFGFSDSGYGCANSAATVGSRLLFQKQADEERYRKPLEELYIAYKLM